ncbi:MAG: TIGR03013 family PEP-CTERM/XrtA system glycosyltransferase [Burkholderiales bacterium]|nr:TIGR03013 family PEP-CTERM/XrtA system glycosyltransferase [Burkholderiales bacterium]MDE2398363.1 TIGR03013 family PEP-CTERM/XrtA system glycosyltransferase [Burkholderiales bacterium]
MRTFSLYRHRLTLASLVFDLTLFVLLILAMLVVLGSPFDQVLPAAGPHVLSLAAGVAVLGTASGMYAKTIRPTLAQSLARAVLMLAVALPLTYLLMYLLPGEVTNKTSVRVLVLVSMTAVVLRRALLRHWGTKAGARTRVLIFGTGAAAATVGSTLVAADPEVEIVGYVLGPNEKDPAVPVSAILPGDMPLTLAASSLAVDEIVVALTERRAGSMPLRQLLDCKLLGIKVYDLATHFEKRLGQIRVDYVNAGWLIFGDGFNQGTLRTAVKRVFDIVFAALLAVLSAPIMLVTALAIKLDSAGPVLYTQERVGLDGKSFMVTKFRSMRTDAERDGKPRWASAGDDRVTRVGRLIRKLRIDELPQLFNVLRGDMSLVGPRPERPYFVEQLTRDIPFFAARHSVKPGVTGWAQVRYKYGETVEDSQEKLQYDLYYVKNHSLFLDLVVLFETVGVVLTGHGAH